MRKDDLIQDQDNLNLNSSQKNGESYADDFDEEAQVKDDLTFEGPKTVSSKEAESTQNLLAMRMNDGENKVVKNASKEDSNEVPQELPLETE